MEATYIGQNLYIRPSYVVSLPEYYGVNRCSSAAFIENKKNLTERDHNGSLSFKAIKNLKNAINWMVCAATEKNVFNKKTNKWFKFKVSFVTLTLPDTSKEIDNKTLQKLLLNPFLTYMRKFHGLKNYVWKLEFQKNGKLHVHITMDVFIHYAKIRSTWNKLLGSNNFLIDFYNKFGHSDPNSTDVHSTRSVRDLAAYMAKYMSKQSSDLIKIKGRIWGCNQELSQANKTKIFLDRDQCYLQLRPLFHQSIEFTAIESKNKMTGLSKKIGEIFFLKYQHWQNIIKGDLKEKFEETILFLKNILIPPDLTYTV